MDYSVADLVRLGPRAQQQAMAQIMAREAEKTRGAEEEKKKKGSKYHAEKASRGDLTFDSKKEARRYDELMLMKQAGMIRDLKLQVRFCLIEGFKTTEGVKHNGEYYVADFVYERKTVPDCNGDVHWLKVVEDVKGYRTQVYRNKAKLFRERYGFSITEV